MKISKMVAVDSLLFRTREELGATTQQLAEKEGAKISNVLQIDTHQHMPNMDMKLFSRL